MADFGVPTANYTPPDGLQTLGNLMSLKSKQLAIQGQQQGLAGQAAQVQMTQQDAAQRAALANVDWDKHTDENGILDTASFAKDPAIRKAAGDQYPDLLAKANQVRQGQLQNQKSLLSLNQDQLGALGSIVGGLKTDQDVQQDNAAGRQKVTNALSQFSDTYGPEAARIGQIFGPQIQHVPQGKLASAIEKFQLQTQSAGQQLQTTQPGGALVQGRQGLNVVNTNPYAAPPVGSQVGRTITDQGLAPTDQPGYRGAVASAVTRATGVGGTDIDRANEVGAAQQQSAAAIPLTHRIDQLADEINSGHLAKMISETGNYLGFSSVNEARSQLNKDLGQVKGLAVARSGSDARAATILEGYPSDTTPASTVHAAMDYIRGTAKQNLARGALLTQYQKTSPDLQGFAAADNVLNRTTNPLIHEYLTLKTPQEQAEFLKRNHASRADAAQFIAEANAAKNHTNVIGQ